MTTQEITLAIMQAFTQGVSSRLQGLGAQPDPTYANALTKSVADEVCATMNVGVYWGASAANVYTQSGAPLAGPTTPVVTPTPVTNASSPLGTLPLPFKLKLIGVVETVRAAGGFEEQFHDPKKIIKAMQQ